MRDTDSVKRDTGTGQNTGTLSRAHAHSVGMSRLSRGHINTNIGTHYKGHPLPGQDNPSPLTGSGRPVPWPADLQTSNRGACVTGGLQ